ncbi:YtxH domain-containing protein [Psychrobacillus vulpis]|uniref:YtxH domain-containing protein n=1 Tax=Psychrobacillus vulpis TaxID=2325572 RepID=A0A544TLS0_9BACI|nr:YtxH domain-containing protein [Psychrobacillus vulpis]TQR18411.1 YtxH domain-containing protein [Psychrobacillus vulpis]
MSNYDHNKPNYNDAKYNNEYYANQSSYNKQMDQMYPPQPIYTESRESIYKDDEVNAKDFIIGALVGGIIGAATALLLAPKSGTELRGNISTQAVQLKDKTKDFSTTAKEKTTQISKQLQEQSGQLVEKVKSIKGKPTSPLDDGTVSSEGEEPIEYMETISHTTDEVAKEQEEDTTVVAEAIKEAVVDSKSNK